MPTRTGPRSAARRAGVLAVVIVAHVGIVAAFINGLGSGAVRRAVFAVQASIIRSAHPPPPPPPTLPRVQLQAPSVDPALLSVPLPIIDLEAPTAPSTGMVGPPRVPVYVPLELLTKPDSDRYYPREASARHLSGTTLTRVCIDAGAHVAGVQVVHSSGSPELDEAAINMAHHLLWRPATLDGKAISDCRSLLVTFQLRSQQHGGRP